MPPWYLHDRQLLLVGERLAVLRPARLFPDSPYLDSVRHIKPGVPSRRTWTCWVVLINKAAGVLLVPPKQIKRDPLWIQFSLEEDLTRSLIRLWKTVLQIYTYIPELQDTRCPCFFPSSAFVAHFWAQRVPISMLFEIQALCNSEVAFDFLRFCFLQPEKIPPWLARLVQTPLGPFPPGFQFLVRTSDFSTARYFADCSFLRDR